MQKKNLSLNTNFLQATWLKCSFQQTVTARRSHVPLTSQLPVPDALQFPYCVTSGKDGKWLSNMHTHTQSKKKEKLWRRWHPRSKLYYQQSLKSGPTNVAILRSRRVYIPKKININTGSFRNIYLDFNESFRLWQVRRSIAKILCSSFWVTINAECRHHHLYYILYEWVSCVNPQLSPFSLNFSIKKLTGHRERVLFPFLKQIQIKGF